MQAELEGKTIERWTTAEEKAFERSQDKASEGAEKARSSDQTVKVAEMFAKAMNAPKRVIRDPKTNRVIGVETVGNGAG
jgi:hypothetical protein